MICFLMFPPYPQTKLRPGCAKLAGSQTFRCIGRYLMTFVKQSCNRPPCFNKKGPAVQPPLSFTRCYKPSVNLNTKGQRRSKTHTVTDSFPHRRRLAASDLDSFPSKQRSSALLEISWRGAKLCQTPTLIDFLRFLRLLRFLRFLRFFSLVHLQSQRHSKAVKMSNWRGTSWEFRNSEKVEHETETMKHIETYWNITAFDDLLRAGMNMD